MLSNMACSLIEHKRINTTVAKAKALRMYIEPIITKSKDDSTHSRRNTFSQLKDKTAVSELFREIAPRVAERPGGYTRIIKTGFRLGDAAEMCMIELVDFNDVYVTEKKAAKSKTRRRRRSGGQVAAETVEATEAPKAEAPAEEAAPAPEAKVEEVVAEATEAPAEEAKEEEKKEDAPAEGDKDGEEKKDA